MISIISPYEEGYESFPNKDCPYPVNTMEYNAWWAGFSQCELDSAYYE